MLAVFLWWINEFWDITRKKINSTVFSCSFHKSSSRKLENPINRLWHLHHYSTYTFSRNSGFLHDQIVSFHLFFFVMWRIHSKDVKHKIQIVKCDNKNCCWSWSKWLQTIFIYIELDFNVMFISHDFVCVFIKHVQTFLYLQFKKSFHYFRFNRYLSFVT